MKLKIIPEAGGYATNLLEKYGEIEITKPFVLFSGQNGSGKTSLITMIRSALGIHLDRAGEFISSHPFKSSDPNYLDNYLSQNKELDIGMNSFSSPGLLDIDALDWQGNPTWLYSSSAEILRMRENRSDHINLYLLDRIFESKVSNGQFLQAPWHEALSWALGILPSQNIFDQVTSHPYSDRYMPGNQERWLFLDEPENSLDTHNLISGLSTLIENSEFGRLRVFCASHSLLFAAGLSNHPNVQTINLGSTDMLYEQKNALAVCSNPLDVSNISKYVSNLLHSSHTTQNRSNENKLSKLSKSLSTKAKNALLKIYRKDDTFPIHNSTMTSLISKNLVNFRGGVTTQGAELAEFIETSAENK